MRQWVIGLIILLMLGIRHGVGASDAVTVYAAASLTSALQELAEVAENRDISLRLAFGSSSTMAKQIAQGAPADLFISANVNWMDFLAEQNLIDRASRINLLGNTLVIIAPKGETFPIIPRADFDIAHAFTGRLALGDPSHVPAGMYARQALERLGWWPALKDRIAPAMDVRGALALVERGECLVGIVYATDAAISSGVRQISALPDSLHAPILYPMAIVRGRRSPQIDTAMRFLKSPEATALFKRYGFRVIPPSQAAH